MRTGIIVQSRMGSARLPGKALADIAGVPMIQRVLNRAMLVEGADIVILATTTLPEDAVLQDLARTRGIACYRGRPDDVLDRYMNAAVLYNLDHIVRITGDCPLIDWEIASDALRLYKTGRWDYVSNRISYPDGLDCECFSFDTLADTWMKADTQADKEHVTSYMYRRPSPFRLQQLWADSDYSKYKWSVDTADELEFVRKVYRELGEGALWREVLDFDK